MKSICTILFCLAIPRFFIAQNVRDELTQKAVESFQKKDFEASIDYFTCIIELYPNDSIAFFDRGFVKDTHCDFTGAIKDFTEQIKIDPESIDSYFLRGMVYEKIGELEQAEADYKKVIQLEYENADAHYFLGLLKQLKCEQKAAMKYFLETVEVNPAHTGALEAIGWLYCQKKKMDNGLIWLNRAIQSDSNCYTAFLHRSWLYAERGNNKEAIQNLEMALQLAGNVDLKYPYIEKQKQNSESLLKSIKENAGNGDEDHFKLGQLLMLLGGFAPAETVFLEIDQNKIDNPNLNYFLALAQMQQGKYEAALISINKMILSNENDAAFYLLRGKIKREIKSNLNWCDDYQKYVRLMPATFKIDTWKECF
jgi:tetratricopeptide (TPR) repeat protein